MSSKEQRERAQFSPIIKTVVEQRCNWCEGSGRDGRATCEPCDGCGKRYDVYHDGSMFPGRDLRGVERVIDCPKHGASSVSLPRCCDGWGLHLRVVTA